MNKLAVIKRLRDIEFVTTQPLDPMTDAPEHHSVLFENDRVRVLDTKLPPAERTEVHAHEWPAVLYVLSWSDFIRRADDGTVLADSRGGPRHEPRTIDRS